MLYLQVKNVHKSFTDKPLLEGVDFSISKGQKVAIVAKNGAGKSTLLKVLEKHIEPSQGEVIFHKNIKVSFLAQSFNVPDDMSVRDAIFFHDNHVGQLIKKYETLLQQPNYEEGELEEVLHEIEKEHGRDLETKAKTIVSKLQLSGYKDKPIGTLSGGEVKRVALAKALIDNPDFLILDEPTNHLDLDKIEWLEKYLKKTSMTLLMVTHDRYFLERVCSDIYELDRGKIITYKGNYENYLTKKAEREELERVSVHKLKQFYKQELAWIRKAPRARESKAVDREKKFYQTESDFKQRSKRLQEQAKGFDLDMKERRLGGKILKLYKVCKSFGDKKILQDFSHNFKQGERIGITGKNGAGKSTFMNILAGIEKHDSGKIDYGTTLTIGYYKQKDANLNSNKSVIEFVKKISDRIVIRPGVILSASRLLERFLFSPKQQQMRVSDLSGGEKKRLHLLTVLIKNPNFLILDEPTNDLDLVTLGVLENFLMTYQGCLIIVSHDRFFMDKLVDHLFIFEGDGKMIDFRGTYSKYQEALKAKANIEKKQSQKSKNDKSLKEQNSVINKQNIAPTFTKTPKKLSFNEKYEFEQLNKDIHLLEERKHEINQIFQEQELDHSQLKEIGKELSDIIQQLEKKEQRRLELAERA